MEEKKYICIAKVGKEKFIRHRVTNLVLYTQYLDKEWPAWRWFNVFGNNSKKQLGNFTNKKRPINTYL